MVLSIALIFAAGGMPVAAAADVHDIVEPNPKAMSSAQIKASNAKFSRSHPFYIRCVKSADTGSLVKRNVSCRTNAQWQSAELIGNQNARDTVEAMQKSSTAGR